jgi:tripartite-type tricarboxylate transporter receptor subunit TctC
MNAEIKKALNSDEVRKFMQQEALDSVASAPEELTAMFKRDIEKYAKVIQFANVRLD